MSKEEQTYTEAKRSTDFIQMMSRAVPSFTIPAWYSPHKNVAHFVALYLAWGLSRAAKRAFGQDEN